MIKKIQIKKAYLQDLQKNLTKNLKLNLKRNVVVHLVAVNKHRKHHHIINNNNNNNNIYRSDIHVRRILNVDHNSHTKN